MDTKILIIISGFNYVVRFSVFFFLHYNLCFYSILLLLSSNNAVFHLINNRYHQGHLPSSANPTLSQRLPGTNLMLAQALQTWGVCSQSHLNRKQNTMRVLQGENARHHRGQHRVTRTQRWHDIADISENPKYWHFSPHIFCIVIVSAKKFGLTLYCYRIMIKMEEKYRIAIVSVKQKITMLRLWTLEIVNTWDCKHLGL